MVFFLTNLPENGVIQSHRFNGPDIAGEISVTTSSTVEATLGLACFTPFCLTVFLELAVLKEELLEEESEEQQLSTETLLCTTDFGLWETGTFGLWGLFRASVLLFDSSETLTLFPAGPRIARGSVTGFVDDLSFVATDIASKSEWNLQMRSVLQPDLSFKNI